MDTSMMRISRYTPYCFGRQWKSLRREWTARELTDVYERSPRI